MNLNGKRLVISGLVFLLLALVSVALIDTPRLDSGLDGGLVRLLSVQRTSAQSKRSSSLVNDLFRNNCARCHGADGRGDTPLGQQYKAPDFTDPAWWQKHSNITSSASLIAIVSRGKGGMPAFGKKLSRAEIRRLVGYVRRFKNQKPSN